MKNGDIYKSKNSNEYIRIIGCNPIGTTILSKKTAKKNMIENDADRFLPPKILACKENGSLTLIGFSKMIEDYVFCNEKFEKDFCYPSIFKNDKTPQ
jgi:hypothetical protein